MIEVRSLDGVSFETMTAAFNDAFSDYDIPARYTTEYLTNLVTRRGYRPYLAVGAFDDDRLVGFVFNCLDGDEAYNSGTGVVISHRRRGIARAPRRSIDCWDLSRRGDCSAGRTPVGRRGPPRRPPRAAALH